MEKQRLFLLFIFIFPCVLTASEFEKPVIELPAHFKKEYWYQLDLYSRGNISFIYSSQKNKILHEIAQNWEGQDICFLDNDNYNQEQCKIKKNEILIDEYRKQQQEMSKKSKKEESEQRDILSRLKQKKASKELDVTLAKKEIGILSKKSEKDVALINKKNQFIVEQEGGIKKIQQIIDHCKLNIAVIRRENKEASQAIDQRISKHQKIIDVIEESFKEKNVSLKMNKASVISLDLFSKVVKETPINNHQQTKIVFLQSLLASLINTEKIVYQALSENLTIYQFYIFSLGMFFKWYVDTKQAKKNGTDTLLQQIIDGYLENKEEWIEPYKKSYFTSMLHGLQEYEIYYMLNLKVSDDFEKLIKNADAIKNILYLLDPFRRSEFFKFLYNTKKEKLNELMNNIEHNVRAEMQEKNTESIIIGTSEENIKDKNQNCLKNVLSKHKTIHTVRNIVLFICFHLMVFFLHFENKTTV